MKKYRIILLGFLATLAICCLSFVYFERSDSNDCATGLSGSQSNAQGDNYKVLTLEIDNNDPSKIGFVETEGDISIGVTSLCVDDHYIYLTDEYHKNIKKIDILSSKITSSKKITDVKTFKQFLDIIEFNNNLYITSSGNAIYIVSKELDTVQMFSLPTLDVYPTYIMTKTDSTLEFFIQFYDSAYTINFKNEIIHKRGVLKNEISRFVNYFDVKLGNIRYKKLKYLKEENSESFIIDNDTVRLAVPFKYSAEAYNVDFNDKFLVVFNIIDNKQLKIYLYYLK